MIGLVARGGTPSLCQVPSTAADARSHHPGVTRLWAVFGATSILIAACTSTPTVSQSNPSTAVCFDSAKVKGLYDEWAHKAADTNLSDGIDMAQVVASLRATREIASELALATAADPVAAGHFKDAADAYLNAPPIPPHASLASMSRRDIYRLDTATGEDSTAMYAGIDALNDSIVPFC
ncbi:MAG: hypothetical protein M3P18_04945 [Actinomycetota bacterium]|nr:hypothetical protein [Actinomycetota bacterium]